MNNTKNKIIAWVVPTIIDLINFSCIGSCWQVLELFQVVKVGTLHVILMLLIYITLLYKNHKTISTIEFHKHLKVFGCLVSCGTLLYSIALGINYFALSPFYYNSIIGAILVLLLAIVHYTFRYVLKSRTLTFKNATIT